MSIVRYATLRTVARRYKVTPKVVRMLAAAAPMHGSIGRAIQVGSEILAYEMENSHNCKKFIAALDEDISQVEGETRRGSMTYKLVPRTVELIERLHPFFGDHGRTLAACAVLLGRIKG